MTKRLYGFFSILLILFFVAPAVSFAYNGPQLVFDDAGLLSASEQQSLSSFAEEISDKFDCTAAIAFVKDLNGYQFIQDYADDFYDSNGYGSGASHDGILLVVAMKERKIHLTTTGKAIDIFTDFALEELEDSFLGSLSAGNYREAADQYLSKCNSILKHFEQTGIPLDSSSTDYSGKNGFSLPRLLSSLGLGTFLGGAPLMKQKKAMKSVQSRSNASDYKSGDLRLTVSKDRFINKSLSRVPKPKDTNRSSGGGGSSIHFSSSGTSHGGRSGSF